MFALVFEFVPLAPVRGPEGLEDPALHLQLEEREGCF